MVIYTHGDKGGVGKSMTVAILADHLIPKGRSVQSRSRQKKSVTIKAIKTKGGHQ